METNGIGEANYWKPDPREEARNLQIKEVLEIVKSTTKIDEDELFKITSERNERQQERFMGVPEKKDFYDKFMKNVEEFNKDETHLDRKQYLLSEIINYSYTKFRLSNEQIEKLLIMN